MKKEEGTITFTKHVKNELASLNVRSKKAKSLMLAGFTRLASTLSIGANPSLTYKTSLSKVAKLIYEILKKQYGLIPEIVYEKQMHFNKSISYLIIVRGSRVYDLLSELKVSKNFRFTPLRALINNENIKDFTKGLFLANGSINAPESKNYFLQITFEDEQDALSVKDGLINVNPRFSFKVIKYKKSKWMLYLKKSSEISEFLYWLGATNSGLEYENARVTKDFFNVENRWNNCYAANYSKALKTGEKNIEDINIVLSTRSLHTFNDISKKIIEYRLNNKDASYSEIAKQISTSTNKISKSMVARTFSNISDEAEKIKIKRELETKKI